jgi:hypothetical protein
LGRGDRHQAHKMWAGRPMVRLPGIPSPRSGGMVGYGHDQAGSITCNDHAPKGGHAVRRARVLAVPEPSHPACSARQRISPSRRP